MDFQVECNDGLRVPIMLRQAEHIDFIREFLPYRSRDEVIYVLFCDSVRFQEILEIINLLDKHKVVLPLKPRSFSMNNTTISLPAVEFSAEWDTVQLPIELITKLAGYEFDLLTKLFHDTVSLECTSVRYVLAYRILYLLNHDPTGEYKEQMETYYNAYKHILMVILKENYTF
jgi:hypothetical protein